MIVSHEKKDIIRSHHDLEKDTSRYTKKASRVSQPSDTKCTILTCCCSS